MYGRFIAINILDIPDNAKICHPFGVIQSICIYATILSSLRDLVPFEFFLQSIILSSLRD